MEHISEILKKQTGIDISKENTATWSNAEAEEQLPVSDCAICGGSRFVHPLLANGKPDYSQVIPCSCTRKELDEERQSRLQRYSNLGLLAQLTFDNLNPHGKNESPIAQERFNQVYQAARAFAEEPTGWLVLTGPSGCGKTHLAAAIATYCINNLQPVFYITVPDLLDHLRSSFSPDSEIPYDEFFEQIRNTPLLILDDLGAQSGTPWAKEKLDQLLNHRFSNRFPTVIVSIIPVDELEERIRVRLANSNLCQICNITEEPQKVSVYDWSPEFEKEKMMTFKTFDWKRVNLPLEDRQNLDKAYHLAVEFAKSPDGWLVFMGDNGCGKTHLASAIVNYRYENKQPALFVVVPDFLDHLRSTFSPDSKISYDQYFESVKNAPLLVLDDLGRQTTKPWAQEKLYQVINYRYNACLPTVVTTNCSIDELDDPISSRFIDSKLSILFNITAPNYYSGRSTRKRASRIDKK